MNRIDARFAELRHRKRVAFIPYVTAGDPDVDGTVAAVLALAEAGADLVELGVPYSDPLADGPTIQDAFTRVLAKGFHVTDVFEIARRVREKSDVPLLAMVSYSIVYRFGVERFVIGAQDAGIDGAIIPDLSIVDGGELLTLARERDFKTVLLVAPTTEPDRERDIIEHATGFVYCVSVVGITGARAELPPELADHVNHLRTLTDKPICVGFGVSKPEHVATVARVADGVIVGSAIVRQIAKHANDRSKMLAELSAFVKNLTAPLRN